VQPRRLVAVFDARVTEAAAGRRKEGASPSKGCVVTLPAFGVPLCSLSGGYLGLTAERLEEERRAKQQQADDQASVATAAAAAAAEVETQKREARRAMNMKRGRTTRARASTLLFRLRWASVTSWVRCSAE
jgi:type IV secretory pathway TrbL component